MKDSIRKFIGKNIRELREEHGVSRINMAMEMGYSQSNYGKIESGQQQLACQGLIILCKQFSCKPERIVFGEKDTAPQFLSYFAEYSEYEKRRILRMLYLFLKCQNIKAKASFHKIFGSDILSKIPPEEENVLPLVLEYERKAKDITRSKMISFLGISKNKYYNLLSGEPLSNIDTLIMLHEKLGYDMSFLLLNRVNPELFFSVISHSWNSREQELFEKQMGLCSAMDRLSMNQSSMDKLSGRFDAISGQTKDMS